MTDLQERIIAVVATQKMRKKELTDYISLEGWKNVPETIQGFFDDGTLELNSSGKVVLA